MSGDSHSRYLLVSRRNSHRVVGAIAGVLHVICVDGISVLLKAKRWSSGKKITGRGDSGECPFPFSASLQRLCPSTDEEEEVI